MGFKNHVKTKKNSRPGQKLSKTSRKLQKKITAEPMGHLIKASRHGVCSFFEVLATFAHTLL